MDISWKLASGQSCDHLQAAPDLIVMGWGKGVGLFDVGVTGLYKPGQEVEDEGGREAIRQHHEPSVQL